MAQCGDNQLLIQNSEKNLETIRWIFAEDNVQRNYIEHSVLFNYRTPDLVNIYQKILS